MTEVKLSSIVIGSVQIWNIQNGTSEMFYLMNIKENSKKFSYAASFGVSNIPEKYKEKIAQCLSSFQKILVREESGRSIIRELIGYDSKFFCDPVFLLSGETWKK